MSPKRPNRGLLIGLCVAGPLILFLCLRSRLIQTGPPSDTDGKEGFALPTAPVPRVEAQLLSAGIGEAGLKEFGIDTSRLGLRVAGWGRLQVRCSDVDRSHFGLQACDGSGKVVPATTVWKADQAFVLLPRGYRSAPRRLKLRLYYRAKAVGNDFALPELPPVKSRSAPKTSGLPVRVRAYSRDGVTYLSADAKLATGHILGVRVVGSDLTDLEAGASTRHLFGCGAPILTAYELQHPRRECFSPELYFPRDVSRIDLSVEEMVLAKRKLRFVFPPVPTVRRNGAEWPAPNTMVTSEAGGVRLSLRFPDPTPSPSSRPRRPMRVVLEGSGMFLAADATLMSPKSAGGTPLQLLNGVRLLTAFDQQLGAAVSNKSVSGKWSDHIVVDLEVSRFEAVRTGLVSVDLPGILPPLPGRVSTVPIDYSSLQSSPSESGLRSD